MPGKKAHGAPKPSNGKGKAPLSELDPNVQSPTGAASARPGRSRRQAAIKAASDITEQSNLSLELEIPGSSPPSKGKAGRLAKSARVQTPTPGRSRPIRRTNASKSVPVPLESESDPDFPSDEDASPERLSDAGLDDEALEGFDREYLPCPENGDEVYDEDDDETDVEDQSDVESDYVDPSEDGDEEVAPISAKAKGKRPATTAAPVPKVAGSRRPKRPRKTASPKRPVSEISAEQWLRDQNEKSGIKPDDPNVKRFQNLMMELVRRLSAKCRIAGSGKEYRKEQTNLNEALHATTQIMFRTMEPTDICEAIFKHMPLVTQKILGEPNLKEKDLQGLPKGAAALVLPGTYLDVLGRFRPDQITREPHPDLNFKKIDGVRTLKPFVRESSALEIRLYLGSAIATLTRRIRAHFLEMNRPDDDKKHPQTAHYCKFGNWHDVVPDFRVTSVWEPEDDDRFPVLTEGLLMTYLGLQNSGEDSPHHPSETFALNLELRAGLDLPDFMGISLNRAWPLFQGIGRIVREAHACENPTHPSESDGQPVYMNSIMKAYRCLKCHVHVHKHGADWPIKSDGQRVNRQNNISAAEKQQGCANPRHKETWDVHCKTAFNQVVGGPRCNQCGKWVTAHGRDYPIDANGVDTSAIKTCQNPGHEDHWSHHHANFKKDLNGNRCPTCVRWYKKQGRDYPYLANGQTRRIICENPGHPAGADPLQNAYETDGTIRCHGCRLWYRKYGVDKPAKS